MFYMAMLQKAVKCLLSFISTCQCYCYISFKLSDIGIKHTLTYTKGIINCGESEDMDLDFIIKDITIKSIGTVAVYIIG